MMHEASSTRTRYGHKMTQRTARLLGRSRTLTIALVILGFGLLLLLINLYQLRLMQYDHELMHGSAAMVEGQADKPSEQPSQVVWIEGKNQHTGYLKHIHAAFDRLGYIRGGPGSDWDVLWSHDYPFLKLKGNLSALKPHQKINHFPGSGYLTNKVSLATSNLTSVPKAFQIPKDKDKFLAYATAHPNALWVQKKNSHRGVQIKKPSEIDFEKGDSFIQAYVDNPLLIDNRRFDIGVYTTLTSVKPLRVYADTSDWLLRFCSQNYNPFSAAQASKYVITDDYTPIWKMPSLMKLYSTLQFSKRESLLAYIRQQGKDPNLLVERVNAAIREVYLSKEQLIFNAGTTYPSRRHFFEMVRIDFLVDKDLNVYMMEINMSPNLSSGHFPQNRLLYEQIVYGLLNLVGVGHFTASDYIRGTSDEQEMQVSSKDIHVYSDECASATCNDNCRTQECKLCSECLKAGQRVSLEDAYLEHTRRTTWRRVFPRNFKNRDTAMYWEFEKDREFQKLSGENKMMEMWFRGKCLQDLTWCA